MLAAGHACELVIISTEGDRNQGPIAEIGVGVFTAALREAIHDGRVDMAVHSYKDLPTARDDRFVIAAVPPVRTLVTRWWRVTGWCSVSCRRGPLSARRVRDGPRSLEHWVSVWKSAPTRQPRYQVEQGYER